MLSHGRIVAIFRQALSFFKSCMKQRPDGQRAWRINLMYEQNGGNQMVKQVKYVDGFGQLSVLKHDQFL